MDEHKFTSDYFKFLLKHKELIVNQLEKNINNNRIAEKYYWLRRYHNEHIDSLNDKGIIELGKRKEKFLINSFGV